jgi:hypothetical protein
VARTFRIVIALLFIYTGSAGLLLLAGVELPFAVSLYKNEPDSLGKVVIQVGVPAALVAFGLADLLRIKRRSPGQ